MRDGPKILAIRGLICGGGVTLLLVFLGLFLGAPRHRRIRAWLALTALVAGWAALLSSLPDVAWAGQRWRVGRRIADFERVAAPLRADWPMDDGTIEKIGPFSAYPIAKPRVLVLLTPRTDDFSSIERSPQGGLRFLLAGEERGSWLEWHPAGSAPASFVGGLETRHRLLRAGALGEGWWLTVYDARPLE